MPIRKVSLLRLIPLASLVLTACTLTKPGPATSPTSPQWLAHEQAVQQLEQYQTRGAFAYLTDQKKVYARFFWQQYTPDRYRLLLTNPLGSTELELNVQKSVVQSYPNGTVTIDDVDFVPHQASVAMQRGLLPYPNRTTRCCYIL